MSSLPIDLFFLLSSGCTVDGGVRNRLVDRLEVTTRVVAASLQVWLDFGASFLVLTIAEAIACKLSPVHLC